MVEFAKWDMRRELAALWRVCFNESARYPKYFLNNYFLPENCLVYRTGGQIAAAVYLLPAWVTVDGKKIQAHYIFAAGTFPEFRSYGYMSSLLNYAETVGAKRGDNYSIVLPSSLGLYKFYEKSGYKAFFQIRQLLVSYDRMKGKSVLQHPGKVIVESRKLNSFRNSCLSGQNGSVIWSDQMFHFAAGMGAIYGDKLVCCTTGGKISYALCRMVNKNSCSILEIMADASTITDLSAAIVQAVPAENYRIRLKVGNEIFPNEGKLFNFGMIKTINGSGIKEINPYNPYLGLALD